MPRSRSAIHRMATMLAVPCRSQDGTNCAKIALLGSYMASGFVTESDHHGGTMVLAERDNRRIQPLLANPQHA